MFVCFGFLANVLTAVILLYFQGVVIQTNYNNMARSLRIQFYNNVARSLRMQSTMK